MFNSVTSISYTNLKANKDKWESILLVLGLLCLSGNPTLDLRFPVEIFHILFALYLLFKLTFKRQKLITLSFVQVSSIFAALLLVQCVSFSFYPYITMAGFFTRLFIGYAVIRLLPDFPRVFVKVLVVLAIFSLIFYCFQQISYRTDFDFVGFLTPLVNLIGEQHEHKLSLLFHTFMTRKDTTYRNAGMFWEPGAYAGYLILAIIFLAFIKKDISKRYYITSLVLLSCTLLSTFSTTGYFLYPLTLLLHYDWYTEGLQKKVARLLVGVYIFLPIILGSSLYAFNDLEFMGDKIQRQLYAFEYRKPGWYRGRIGTIIFDWNYIRQRPLTGWGLHSKTRFSQHPWMTSGEGMGNGMSDFTVKFGIVGFGAFLLFVYRSFMRITGKIKTRSLYILLLIILTLQGEAFLNFPLFLGLMFLQIVPRDKISNYRYRYAKRAACS